jgi:hypothetical protein
MPKKYCNLRPRLIVLTTVILASLISGVTSWAQEEKSNSDLNLLKTPSSVGLTLLDFDISTVPRPQTPTDLTITILNETNDLQELPQDFAMEFSPYWVLGGEDATFEELAGDQVSLKSIWQNLQVSVATKARNDTAIISTDSIFMQTSSDLALGINISILRGKRSKDEVEAFNNIKNGLRNLRNVMDQEIESAKAQSSEFEMLEDELGNVLESLSEFSEASDLLEDGIKALEVSIITTEESISRLRTGGDITEIRAMEALLDQFIVKLRMASSRLMLNEAQISALEIQAMAIQGGKSRLEASFKAELVEKFRDSIETQKKLVMDAPRTRVGPRFEVAGGVVTAVPGRDIDRAKVKTYGLWMTGGYEGESLSLLGVARILGDGKSGNQATWDLGARIIGDFGPRLSGSLESAYRHVNQYKEDNFDTWRMALRIDYLVGKNKTLAVTFGRDFEGKTSGNLLTMLQLVLGFGSSRPIDIN